MKQKILSDKILFKTSNQLYLQGNWNLLGISQLVAQYQTYDWPKRQHIEINLSSIETFDSAGMWLLYKIKVLLEKLDNQVELIAMPGSAQKIYDLIIEQQVKFATAQKTVKKEGFFYKVGLEAYQKYQQLHGFVTLLGELTVNLINSLQKVKNLQLNSIAYTVYHAGIKAGPILGLLSFLIGVVLAYQMGLQLEAYGANIYIVYLSGMAVFREFGPLIAAIIVAGRSSSSFTAELGTMKVNEEIDALLTMGLSPVNRLVLPKVIGLVIVFPLLIFWSNLFGILGCMVMAKVMLGINYLDFFHRLKSDVGLTQYLIGFSKAPVFAIIIALVGCYQGFLVSLSADSVGIQTTKSVVQALFLIIIADALFSIFYSAIGV